MGNTRLRFSCFQTSDCASLMPLGSQWPQLTSVRDQRPLAFGALEFENEGALRGTKQSVLQRFPQHCGTISIE
ncbi:hypothetical protein CKAH01_10090 [Colletotrichum kahawae]|uniref:Uncharacterized protein n=1 Tax=Colletotrichum kahawae TaxID=34407 RepID=A0AAD9XYJ7_COLKA|nr:hypothetical protein CKAH01_10090 [Colletotrichum kahawae]